MSGMWHKTLVYLGLVEEPDEHDALETVVPRGQRTAGHAEGRRGSDAGAGRAEVRALHLQEDRSAHVRAVEGSGARVAIVRARTFEDAEEVGERFRSHQPVLVDLAEVDREAGQRLLDFVSGIAFALRGRLATAGGRAYLLVPTGTELAFEERQRLADLGYRVEGPVASEAES
ncbi:MAG: cell division protein SepF [Nitriliruptorales bacterium]